MGHGSTRLLGVTWLRAIQPRTAALKPTTSADLLARPREPEAHQHGDPRLHDRERQDGLLLEHRLDPAGGSGRGGSCGGAKLHRVEQGCRALSHARSAVR